MRTPYRVASYRAISYRIATHRVPTSSQQSTGDGELAPMSKRVYCAVVCGVGAVLGGHVHDTRNSLQN
jgi:hypothetical protein